MNQDEKAGVVVILALLLGYVYYRTGVFQWQFPDQLGLTTVIISIPFFLFLFFKRRFR